MFRTVLSLFLLLLFAFPASAANDSLQRYEAVRGLPDLEEPQQALDLTLEALTDPSFQVRMAAAWALGRITADVIPGLQTALNDPHDQVRREALLSTQASRFYISLCGNYSPCASTLVFANNNSGFDSSRSRCYSALPAKPRR